MRLSIFPNTYAEVILLRLYEININAFLSNGSKQMPIMPHYNNCLPVSRTVASVSRTVPHRTTTEDTQKVRGIRTIYNNFQEPQRLIAYRKVQDSALYNLYS